MARARAAAAAFGGDVVLTGILPTLSRTGTILAREVQEEIERFFGPKVFKTRIRNNVRLAEAPSHGKSIFDYAPESNGAEDYLALARIDRAQPTPSGPLLPATLFLAGYLGVWTGFSAVAIITSGCSSHLRMSTFSPFSSSMMLRMRLPRTPTHAPMGSTLRSSDSTASFVL